MKYKNLFVNRNDPFVLQLSILQNYSTFSGYSVKLYFAKHESSKSKFEVSGEIIDDTPNTIIQISISSASTKGIKSGTYMYSVFLESPNQESFLLLTGNLHVSETIFPDTQN